MSSRLSIYRRKMKEERPEKYEEYLKRQREAARVRREANKQKRLTEPLTKEMKEKIEREREQSRIRSRRYYVKMSAALGRPVKPSNSRKCHQCRPRDMGREEYLKYRAWQRAESRRNMSSEKKKKARERDVARKRMARLKKKRGVILTSSASLHIPPPPPPSSDIKPPLLPATPEGSPSASLFDEEPGPSQPQTSSGLPKALLNLTARIEAELTKETKGSHILYAQAIKILVTPRSPEKRKAIQDLLSPPEQTQTNTSKQVGVSIENLLKDIKEEIQHVN